MSMMTSLLPFTSRVGCLVQLTIYSSERGTPSPLPGCRSFVISKLQEVYPRKNVITKGLQLNLSSQRSYRQNLCFREGISPRKDGSSRSLFHLYI